MAPIHCEDSLLVIASRYVTGSWASISSATDKAKAAMST